LNKYLKITILFFLSLIIVGCQSHNEKTEGNNHDSKEKIEPKKEKKQNDIKDQLSNFPELASATDAPETLEEVIDYPAGPFANAEFDEGNKEVITSVEKLPTIEGEVEEEFLEAYWNYLLSLFAVDYKGPEVILDKMKVKSFWESRH
jgi:Ca-activated chloride channel homolog